MAIITGIRFKQSGKSYYFDPGELDLHKGQLVIVETARGIECGEVSIGRKEVPDDEIIAPLKKVIRIATEEDIRKEEENKSKEAWAFKVCEEKIAQHHLDMHLVEAEYSFDGSKIVFFFTADGRVDFRALVRDLASVFRTRIELRQIGVRDEVKLIGGLGPCGRETCCRSFLPDFEPVSIRMAKDQNLSLNPAKISGICGRLMCCLSYEQDFYQKTLKRCPKKGAAVKTPVGMGTVMEVDVLRERAKIRVENANDGDADVMTFLIDELGDDPKSSYEARTQREMEEKAAEAEEIPDVLLMNGSKAYVETAPAPEKALKEEPKAQPAEGSAERNQQRHSGNNRRGNRGGRNDRGERAERVERNENNQPKENKGQNTQQKRNEGQSGQRQRNNRQNNGQNKREQLPTEGANGQQQNRQSRGDRQHRSRENREPRENRPQKESAAQTEKRNDITQVQKSPSAQESTPRNSGFNRHSSHHFENSARRQVSKAPKAERVFGEPKKPEE